MTVGTAIQEVNTLMPNTVDENVKISWLRRLDAQITDEIINTHKKPEGYKEPDFASYNTKTELVVDEVHAELYISYLRMKIALVQMESERYKMESENYNNQLITFRNYYNRKNMPLTKAVPRYR